MEHSLKATGITWTESKISAHHLLTEPHIRHWLQHIAVWEIPRWTAQLSPDEPFSRIEMNGENTWELEEGGKGMKNQDRQMKAPHNTFSLLKWASPSVIIRFSPPASFLSPSFFENNILAKLFRGCWLTGAKWFLLFQNPACWGCQSS